MNDFRSQIADISAEIADATASRQAEAQQPQPAPHQQTRTRIEPPVQIGPEPEQPQNSQSEGEPPEHPETDENAQDDSGEIRDLKGLVEAIDVDAEWLYGLGVPMGDNEAPIPLGQLKDELTKAKRQARDLEQTVAQYKETAGVMPQIGQQIGAWSDEMRQAHGLMTAIEQQYQSTNWDDPNADKADLIDFKQKLVERYAQAQNLFKNAEQRIAGAQYEALQVRRQQQAGELLKKIPEWENESVQQKERAAIIDVAKSYGYSEQELGQIMDHRSVVLLRDLMRLKAQLGTTEKTAAQIRKAPKVLGTRGRTKMNSSEKVDALIQQARNSPRNQKGRAELSAAKAVLGVL